MSLVLYLYALAGQLSDVEDLKGVQGESLIVIAIDGAVAVAGEVAERPSLDADTLKAQDRLVRQLHDRASALLPMRFGVTAADQDAAVRAIGAREGVLQRLAAVRGCEQMIVRVFASGERQVDQPCLAEARDQLPGERRRVADTPGRRYLEARATQRTSSPELLAIERAAVPLQRHVRVEPAHQPGLHGSVYHLIERGHAEEYRAAIERAAAGLSGVRVVISGPSPPYAFA